MSNRRARRRIRIGAAIVSFACAGSLAVAFSPPASALETPVITAASPYAINVPSSVLVAAVNGQSAGTVTSSQLVGLLANSQQFDSDWVTTSVGQEMGGTTTLTPPSTSTLSPSQLAALDQMDAEFAGAPSTELLAMTKVVGGKAIPVVGAVLTGIQLGAAEDRALGVDVNGGLCAGAPNFGFQVTNAILAGLTGTDCASWTESQELQAARNQDTVPTVTEYGEGTQSCDQSHCATITGLSPDGDEYCITSADSFFSSSQYTLGTFPGYPWLAGANYSTTAPGLGNECGAPPPGDFASMISVRLNASWDLPLTAWKADQGADATSVPSPKVTYPDPTRTLQCKVTMTDGTFVTSTSAPFTEGSSSNSVSRPVLPAVPEGEVPATVQCYETGGPQDLSLLSSPTTLPFQTWSTDDPECGNGSCLLDLQQVGAGSCFFTDIDCDGWISDPDRAQDYACYYGTHLVSLSECYIYGTTFNAADRSSGHAYADPLTGEITDGQTSASDVDTLTSDLLKRGQETWGPTPAGYSLGLDGEEAEGNEARQIAAFCVAQSIEEECESIPIFAPGSNVSAAAIHDLEAETGTGTGQYDSPIPQSPLLFYAQPGSRVSSGWYSSTPPCVAGSYDGTVDNCDEYPFNSTTTAGPGASLRVINLQDNQNEGQYLNHFYSVCGVNDPAGTGKFLTIPTPTVPTSEWCIPGS